MGCRYMSYISFSSQLALASLRRYCEILSSFDYLEMSKVKNSLKKKDSWFTQLKQLKVRWICQ